MYTSVYTVYMLGEVLLVQMNSLLADLPVRELMERPVITSDGADPLWSWS